MALGYAVTGAHLSPFAIWLGDAFLQGGLIWIGAGCVLLALRGLAWLARNVSGEDFLGLFVFWMWSN